MTNNKSKGKAIKYILYFAIIFILFILETTPTFLSINGIKPNFLYPCLISIAMVEDEFVGGIFGVIIGLFCDYATYSSSFGFNTILLLIVGVLVGLLTVFLIKNNKLNAFLFTISLFVIRFSLEYFFVYYIWNYENSYMIITEQFLPITIYSSIFSVPIYLLFKKIHTKIKEKFDLE